MREQMDKTLKEVVVPYLRKLGFKGSFPHFYRDNIEHADLITFQFKSGGGSFVVEISNTGINNENITAFARGFPLKKIHASHSGNRLRLGSQPLQGKNDYWYCYTKQGLFGIFNKPNYLAKMVLKQLKKQAEPWWKEFAYNKSLKQDK